MSNIVTAHSACIKEFIEVLGLQGKAVVEISFKVGVGETMYLYTKEFVQEDKFEQVLSVMRKYKVTEIPKEGETNE